MQYLFADATECGLSGPSDINTLQPICIWIIIINIDLNKIVHCVVICLVLLHADIAGYPWMFWYYLTAV